MLSHLNISCSSLHATAYTVHTLQTFHLRLLIKCNSVTRRKILLSRSRSLGTAFTRRQINNDIFCCFLLSRTSSRLHRISLFFSRPLSDSTFPVQTDFEQSAHICNDTETICALGPLDHSAICLNKILFESALHKQIVWFV